MTDGHSYVPLGNRPGNPAHLLSEEDVGKLIAKMPDPYAMMLQRHMMAAERVAFENGSKSATRADWEKINALIAEKFPEDPAAAVKVQDIVRDVLPMRLEVPARAAFFKLVDVAYQARNLTQCNCPDDKCDGSCTHSCATEALRLAGQPLT